MASKISVKDNRVTIDDVSYEITGAGTDRYTITNEFGNVLGNFELRGMSIRPDDYNLRDAPPVVEVAKLWRDANMGRLQHRVPPPSKMVCEVVTWDALEEEPLPQLRNHRRWLKKQEGTKGAFFARDPESGKITFVRVFVNKDRMAAIKAEAGPAEMVEPEGGTVAALQLIEDF